MDISELLGTIGKTEEQDKISYSAGVVMAMSLKDLGFEEISSADFIEGMDSVFNNSFPKITAKRAVDIFNNYIALLREEQKEKNATEGRVFLEQNAQREGVVCLPSGLQYEVLRQGKGQTPNLLNHVEVTYEGYLVNNEVFDSSKHHSGGVEFEIGEMIPGWQEVLQLMPEGSRWKVYIPHYLAYGEAGAAPMIQPNSTLIFIIELKKIIK